METTMRADGDLLHVEVKDRAEQPKQHCAREILAESIRLGIHRILVEVRQRVPLSGVSQFRLVEALPGLGMTHRHRVALVHHTPGFFEANQLIGIVAENRGINLRSFPNLESARAWLG